MLKTLKNENPHNLLVYNFSKYIHKLRKEHGYTLKEVAKKTNLKPSALHKIENGEVEKINPTFLLNISKLYNINILVFYTMLGYIEENDIILFSEILKKQNEITEYFRKISNNNKNSKKFF